MSRIGLQTINIPEKVEVKIEEGVVKTKGPKGELEQQIPSHFKVEQTEEGLKVSVDKPDNKQQKSDWGTYASLIKNILQGVSEGFEKQLEIQGVGYGFEVQGKKLVLKVGFSHPAEMELPEGIEAKLDKNILTLTGIDKQVLGNFAANIRKVRPPEPYKGKGIRYVGEYVRKKAGKQAAGGEE